jgi:hypothetical protein
MPAAPPLVLRMRPFKAIVWVGDPTVPGERVELMAESLEAAEALVRERFGPDATISLWNEAGANRVR